MCYDASVDAIKNPAAVALGRLGGLAGKGKHDPELARQRKLAAIAAGKPRGGRPRNPKPPITNKPILTNDLRAQAKALLQHVAVNRSF